MPKLLHLCTGLHTSTASVAAALESAGHRVRALSDAFSAIAAITTMSPGSIHALVACVDGMTDSDMELFDLIHARFPSIRVYVYGDARSRPRIDRAVRAGALEVADMSIVVTPAGLNVAPATDVRREVSLAEAAAQAQSQVAMRRQPAQPGSAAIARDDDPPDGSATPQPVPAEPLPASPRTSVPWNPNPSAPRRTPPSRNASNPTYPAGDVRISSDRPGASRPPAPDDALLTPEQIAAILSGFHRTEPPSPTNGG